MTTPRKRQPGPRIGEEFGWRQVNGWEKLRQILGSIPNAIPHVLSITVDVAHTGNNLVETTGTGTVIVPPECEFYCLATSASGHIVGTVTQGSEYLFSGLARNTPEGHCAKVLMQYESGGYRWSNAPVRLGHIFGSGERPYYWPAPWIIPGGTQVKATVSYRNNGTHTVRHYLQLIGFKRFNTERPLPTDFLLTPKILDVVRRARLAKGGVRVEPYVYALNFDTLENVASTFGPRVVHGTEQQTFAVSEADFAICEQMGLVELLGDGTITPLIDASPSNTVKIALDVGRRRIDDRALPIVSVFGSARRPYRYAYPLVIARGGNLTAFTTLGVSGNLSSTIPQNAYLTFSGVRIFPSSYR